MRIQAGILLFCALAPLGGCVDPIADVWLLTDLVDVPTVDPEVCSSYFYPNGYLDIDAGFTGSLQYRFQCGGVGWSGEAEVARVVSTGDGSYHIELTFSTGSGVTRDLLCTISGRSMTCRLDNYDRTFEFERGPWFDNSPP